ncbi:MAG: hypothetical protein KKH98_12340, partial [Spirochaetes bacterium]|nr:hypothetical protein [Spirochaetota bacterium]
RAFSEDPNTVIAMASEFIKAHVINNVIPVIKHYPGIGRMKQDPHVTMPVNEVDYTILKNNDLKPFTGLMRSYENGVMIANAAIPSIVKYMEHMDKNNYKDFYFQPASISEVILNKYLIGRNRYKGLIITDEMNVPPITGLMPMNEIVYKSLRAGVDIVLVNQAPGQIMKIMEFLKLKYKKDKVFRDRLKKSLNKILRYKALLYKRNNKANYFSGTYFSIDPLKKQDLKSINNEEHKKINFALSIDTVNVDRDTKKWLPLLDKIDMTDQKFIAISSKPILYNELKKFIRYKNLKYLKIRSAITGNPGKEDIDQVMNTIDNKSVIIIGVQSKAHEKLVKLIRTKNTNIIVLNLLHPYNIKELDQVPLILSSYSDNDMQVKAIVQKLLAGDQGENVHDIKAGNLFFDQIK